MPNYFVQIAKQKRKVFYLFTLFFALGLYLHPTESFAQSATSEVIARLVVFPNARHTGACGRIHFIELMQYEVVSVVRGFVPSTFWVAVSCPNLAGPHFSPGQVHHLRLSRQRPQYWHNPTPLLTGTPSFFWSLGEVP